MVSHEGLADLEETLKQPAGEHPAERRFEGLQRLVGAEERGLILVVVPEGPAHGVEREIIGT
ncbi:MAG: hypothetical protein ACRCYQ_13860, partial [Nocardioides sp.]